MNCLGWWNGDSLTVISEYIIYLSFTQGMLTSLCWLNDHHFEITGLPLIRIKKTDISKYRCIIALTTLPHLIFRFIRYKQTNHFDSWWNQFDSKFDNWLLLKQTSGGCLVSPLTTVGTHHVFKFYNFKFTKRIRLQVKYKRISNAFITQSYYDFKTVDVKHIIILILLRIEFTIY